MLKRILQGLLLLLPGVLLGVPAMAADTDLFASANKNVTGSANVIFVLDNAANFSASVSDMRCSITSAGVVDTSGSGTSATLLDGKAAAVEQCAIYAALNSITATATATFNIGFMGFNDTGMKSYNPATNTFVDNCDGNTGGCLLMPLTAFNSTNKGNILSWVRNWRTANGGQTPSGFSTNDDYNIKSNNNANGAAMQEVWAYLKGKTGVSGRDYASVMPTGGCGNNYIIFVGNAYRNNSTPGDQSNETNSPMKPLFNTSTTTGKRADPLASADEKATVTGTIVTSCGTSTLQTDELKGIYALNWAKYMKNNGVAKTYSVGVLGPTCNAEYAAHLTKLGASEIGGGKYFPTNNYTELSVALSTILTEILSVNTVFSAVSLPASVNTQGEYLNQVFVGMFRPDEDSKPRWPGNVKQYKVGSVNGVNQMIDAKNGSAVNANTGFISECARSFWGLTDVNAIDTYWNIYPRGSCTAVADSKTSNFPDGNVVEKGGAAYHVRAMTPASRVVKTCTTSIGTPATSTTGTCNTDGLTDFTTSSVTNAQLGVSGYTANGTTITADSQRTILVNWIKGKNETSNYGINGTAEGGLSTDVMRPSAHGDVVHSRPAAVNHGTNDSSDAKVVVYYGANDGMLRAVNGNQTQTITVGVTPYLPGTEIWSFIPPEFYSGGVKRLYDNAPSISYPGSSGSYTAKQYGIDGPITPLKTASTADPASKVMIFATMRRGGRAVYAFDVTAINTPTLRWKAGCATSDLADDTNCSSGMTGMGHSWSQVKIIYHNNYMSGTRPIAIFGGGYDTCEDADGGSAGANSSCTSSSKGGKVYVLDAWTGTLLTSFTTTADGGGVRRGVLSEVAVYNVNGKARWGYVGDMGGNVYRIDFTGAPAAWTWKRIASLGCGSSASGNPADAQSCAKRRKFMFMPSIVPNADGTQISVLLGSGDREKPVDSYTASTAVVNYFFNVKDKPDVSGWPTDEATNCSNHLVSGEASVICMSSMAAVPSSGGVADSDLADPKKGWYLGLTTKEQVVTGAATSSGETFFSTHIPASSSAEANSCSMNLGTARAYCVKYTNGDGCFTTGRYSNITGGGLAPSPVLVNITGVGVVCIGCALSASGKAGTGGSGTKEAAGESSGVQAGQHGAGNVSAYHKSRLFWYIEK